MKKMITILLLVLIIFSMAACGQSGTDHPETEAVNPDVYDELIGTVYEVIAAGEMLESEQEGLFSLGVGLGHLNSDEMLQAAGYAVEDLNGDGIPELVLGMVDTDIIYTVYTCSEGTPVLVFESFVRNSYSWLGDGKFHYYGSGSAYNAGFGTFSLPAGGTELVCSEFRFTDVKPGTDSEIGCYCNSSGSWEIEASEELEMSPEELWNLDAEAREQIKSIPYTSFSNVKSE